MAAGDVEGDDHPVSGGEVGHLDADLFDDAHGLEAEDIVFVHERTQYLVEMQVGTVDGRGRYPDDGVRWLLDDRIRDTVDADVPLA